MCAGVVVFVQTTFDQDGVFLGLVVDVYDGEATAKVLHARQDDHPEKGTIEDGVAFRRFFRTYCLGFAVSIALL